MKTITTSRTVRTFLYFLVLFLGVFCLAENSKAANLLYSENFEDGAESDTYGSSTSEYWNTHLGATGVVTDNSHGGTYSFRGSISENGTLDNILGKAGTANAYNQIGLGDVAYGSTANWDIEAETFDEIYVSWWHKWDEGELDNLWDGVSGHGHDTHKIIYFYTTHSSIQNYIIVSISYSRNLELIVNADNAASGDYQANETYHIGEIDDGAWHHFEFYLDYGTGQTADSNFTLTVDDVVVFDKPNIVAIYNTGDRCNYFSLPSNISAATTVVSSIGYQVDDIEVWDGLPAADTISPSTPSGLSVS